MDHRLCRCHDRPGQKGSARRHPHRRHARRHRLSKFKEEFPTRYIDTGICESHLAAMAQHGQGWMRPFAAIYSTFLQRAFDQVWQEVALNQLPVCFCLDRAGFVGDDGRFTMVLWTRLFSARCPALF